MAPPTRLSTPVLGLTRLDSIRNKILLFAMGAALLPSVTTAWVAYRQNQHAITEKIDRELQSASEQAAREMELWLKERVNELKTYTGSYELSENMRTGDRLAVTRMLEYLNALQRQAQDYTRLYAVTLRGQLVASTGDTDVAGLPADLGTRLTTNAFLTIEPTWDTPDPNPQLTLIVPVEGNRVKVGALAADVPFSALRQGIARYVPSTGGRTYLISDRHRVIEVSDSIGGPAPGTPIAPAGAERLFSKVNQTAEYTGLGGEPVIGILRMTGSLGWGLVVEIPTAQAYREVGRLRNTALLVVAALVLGIGLIAYRLGLLIVKPLDRLTHAAGVVAAGDFTVGLPKGGGGEVGYLTDMFNTMVTKLRENKGRLDAANERLQRQNEELERLSVTDGLTGLYNRRRLIEVLHGEIERSKRMNHSCAVLMMDVDHFKKYNDAHGHQAGDEVLRGVGAVLQESTREIDCAARYGGEEFFALLPETDMQEAVEVAERIRTRLKERIFKGGRVSLSIGVALFPTHADGPDGLIAAADAALYQAKEAGRDRVVSAGGAKRTSGSTKQHA